MLSLVIPVFNEEKNISGLLDKIVPVIEKIGAYEIIFVDDGSYDNTFEEIKKAHTKNKKIMCIRLIKNFGQTPALMAGFKQAKGDIIITMDGDLQNDPSDIPKLVKMMEEYDVVSGWRYNRKDPLSKKVPSKLSNWLARYLTNLDIHDFGCTLKAYKKESLSNLELYGEMHRYIPAVLAWRGFKVGEIKVNHHARTQGKSKYGLSRLMKGFLDLINFKFWAGYSTRPLHLFGGIGIGLLSIGLITNLYLVLLKIINGVELSNRPLLLFGVLLMVLGFQVFMTGFLAEIMIRNYYATSGIKTYEIKEEIM